MSKRTDKFKAMTKEERFIYMATAPRVTVRTIWQIDEDAPRPALKASYVALVRGITVSADGVWQHETETEAREFGERILAGWKEELQAMVKAAEEASDGYCIQQYGNPPRKCEKPGKWWFKNPANKGQLEGPYCGYHSKQFLPKALVPVDESKAIIQ